MTALVTSDLHLTESPRDEYRWALFPWLRSQLKNTGARYVILEGDLTDAKDRHNATLVNRIVRELKTLSDRAEVILMKGNHDFIDEAHPFFEFLTLLDSNFKYINTATEFSIQIGTQKLGAVFLPCTKNWKQEWGSLDNLSERMGGDIKQCSYIFTHQTYEGSLAENGTSLQGVPPAFFDGFKGQVVSGDVHVPQKIGKNITYVGAPYRVHFGDQYLPRVLHLKPGKMESLYPGFMEREVVNIDHPNELNNYEMLPGTQVKIKVHLKRQQFGEKAALRAELFKIADENKLEVCGIEWKMIKVHDIADEAEEETVANRSPTEIVKAYAKQKKLDKSVRDAGLGFLKGLQ